jgi:hypothetical protein
MYISNVLAVSNVCCKCFICMLHMLQWLYTYVASVFSKCCSCFIWMLHMFVDLQWLYTYVASVCFKCFTCFRRMLQVFCVLSRCCICCSGYTHMLQTYVSIVLVCCSRCCSPRALTHEHAQAARTHLALPISVMQASSNSRTCT